MTSPGGKGKFLAVMSGRFELARVLASNEGEITVNVCKKAGEIDFGSSQRDGSS